MTVVTKKYNPGFLTDDELVTSFCVREHEFDSMIEMLRDCTGSANSHQIVIGPRGSGKTSLLLRIAAEIRRDADLASRFFPIVFAEDSYEVMSAGEFWLEALSRLSMQAPDPEARDTLHRTWEDLRTVRDDRTLGDRCIGALLDFADREDKRLVLMVENLNAMFADMADPVDAGWRLRKILQTEPRFLLLASATSRFDAIDNPDHALYDLFRVITLRPLEVDECAVLWESVSARRRAPETIRALQILTGGSPRLFAILARFGAELSFRELMADLLDLVDDHTEYFKSHLEALPAQERRVYLALAALWKPATTREIADRARLDTRKCSAQLARLVDRGAAEVTGGSPRRKLYYVTERLYNIYYLMRRASGPDPLIEALVRFMSSYYSSDELRDPLNRPQEAIAAGDEAMRRLASSENPSDLEIVAASLVERGAALFRLHRPEEAMAAWDEVVRRFAASGAPEIRYQVQRALLKKSAVELGQRRYERSIETAGHAIERYGTVPLDPRWRLHVIRVMAALESGDRSSCERDMAAVLILLPDLVLLPIEIIITLSQVSHVLGAQLVRDLIVASPSARLLLPLTAALELRLGIEPRVAREVEEVAEDILLSAPGVKPENWINSVAGLERDSPRHLLLGPRMDSPCAAVGPGN